MFDVYRSELKYQISLIKAAQIRRTLDRLLLRDTHAGDTGYTVRSLYFDTARDKDFFEKMDGVEKRRKYRLRIYDGTGDVCKLEKKEKTDTRQRKQSLVVAREDAEEISAGHFDVLKKYFDTSPFAVLAYSELVSCAYRPVVLVEYERMAWYHPLYDTRITIDSRIRGREWEGDLFSPMGSFLPVNEEWVVLEVKNSGKMPAFISDVLAGAAMEQSACSKYCYSRKIFYEFSG